MPSAGTFVVKENSPHDVGIADVTPTPSPRASMEEIAKQKSRIDQTAL
jgi:hypothetical protein